MITADYTGTILDDKFEVIRLLGEGGMGAVYLARHMTINKPVAVKFLHAALAGREEVVKRFFREARAAAAIRHANIIDVIDIGMSPKKEPYIVMEYLDGEGLSGCIENRGPLSLAAACGVMAFALPALEAAHEKGIVHRDLKPDNIFIERRRGELPGVKLIDFGISKFVDASDQTKLTQDGSMLGTPAYMSPEQARGLKEVDCRTDLYAMGVIFYEMLTGEVPFKGKTYPELLLNMITTEPRDPSTVYPDFPEAARPVVMKALQKNPDERYPSATKMLEDVRALLPLEEIVRGLGELGEYLEKKSAEKDDTLLVEAGDTQLSDELLQKIIRQKSSGEKNVDAHGPTGVVAAAAKRGLTMLAQNGETVLSTLQKRGILDKLKRPYVFWRNKTRNRPKIRFGAAALLVFSAISLIFVLCRDADVTISVKGVPEKAKIFFNGVQMSDNPFETKYSKDPLPLLVKTPGNRAFKISIVPSRDQTVEVQLSAGSKKSHAAKKQDEKSDSSAAPSKKEAASKKDDNDADKENTAQKDKPKKKRFRFWPIRRKK